MARTRSKSRTDGSGTHTHISNWISIRAPVTVPRYSLTSTMTDEVTPNFRQRLAAGEVINNPCSHVKSEVLRTGGGSFYQYDASTPSKQQRIQGSGSLTSFIRTRISDPGLLSIPTGTPSLAESAMSRALAAVDKAPYSIAEDLATLHQTARFLRNPMNTLAKTADAYHAYRIMLKRSRYYRKLKLPAKEKILSDLWLEYQFAFRPLVKSVHTIMQSLDDGASRRTDRIQSSHGVAEFKSEKSDTVPGGWTFGRKSSVDVKVSATVLYRVKPPLREWQYKYGLRVKDIPELMWDLFPLSFMYDRVLDVGSAIRGLTNIVDPSVSILSGTVSVLQTSQQEISVIKHGPQAGYPSTVSPDVDVFKTTSYTRSVWQPNVLDVVPPFTLGNLVKDFTSMADLAALIVQRLK